MPLLPVSIENKSELKNVTGELYSIKIRADKGAGDLFSMGRKVCLVSFANNAQVNKSDVFTIRPEKLLSKEYSFDGHQEIEVLLLDATTKDQLDCASVKQNKDRDLGGLLL